MRDGFAGRSVRGVGLVVAWLVIGCFSIAGARAQTPPQPPGPTTPALTVPAPRPLTVEERLQKLEEMNQKLLEQNQQLSRQLEKVTQAIELAPASPPVGSQKTEDPDVLGTQALTPPVPRPGGTTDYSPGAGANVPGPAPMSGTSAGGSLMARPGGTTDYSPGAGANVVEGVPSRGPAAFGGDLISFAPDDPNDKSGTKANARFGRRFTNNGLWFESENKSFQFHVGGRTQMDTSFFAAGKTVQSGRGGTGKIRDGTDPRRFRIRLEGAMWENMLYTMEVDFVNTAIPQGTAGAGPLTGTANTPSAGSPVPTDLWIGFRKIPVIGHIRIGNQKEPFGFERITSSRFLSFMERSFNHDAFYGPYDNGFIPGIATYNTLFDLRMTYAVGVYKNQTNGYAYDVGGGNNRVTGRLTGTLLYEDEGREVMHLGISGRQSGYDNGTTRFRVRGPERGGLSNIWPLYANTGVINGSGGQQDLNIESANVFGPWTIDAEYNFHFSQNAFLPGQPSVGTLFYSGGYVEVLYFLTGENRAYIRESGVYDRIVPKKNAFWVKAADGNPSMFGSGAWQVGARYNYLDLNDKGINGGVLKDVTLGLNWFLNPNSKFQWNYSVTARHSGTGQSDGTIQGFGMRFAMDY